MRANIPRCPSRIALRFIRATALTTIACVALAGTAHAGGYGMKGKKDIVDTAVSVGSFATLLTAVKVVGLVDTLKGDGPFTKLPAGTVEMLLKPENRDNLTANLTYHVVPGKVMAGDIAGKQTMVKTVEGSSIDVNAMGDVMIDNAKVIGADVEASNGVIHIIDTVIMPKS